MGLPALLLSRDGTVIEANSLVADLTAHVQWRARNRITLADAAANAWLSSALAALDGHSETFGALVSAARRRRQGGDGRALDSDPAFGPRYFRRQLRPAGADPGRGAAGPTGRTDALAVRPDASEARVARGLATGETLEEIAESGGVAISTVRSQLRQVLQKTGCTRQAEVVSLLANVTLDRGAPKHQQ